jgi:hypothetical protein
MNISALLKLFACLAVALLLPLAVTAADGEGCAVNYGAGGGNYAVDCVYLCDSKAAADVGACGTYQFLGAPSLLIVEISEDESCSAAATVTFTTQSASDTDAHTLSTWALTRGGTTAVVVEGSSAQPLAYLIPTIGTVTDCTDLDVRMHLFYEK